MAAPLVKKRRLVAAKIESQAGTAQTLAAADAALNAYDVEITPEIEMSPRLPQSALSRIPNVAGLRGGRVRFKTDLIGGSSDPFWCSTLLLGCGFRKDEDAYLPESRPPEVSGSGAKTLTIGVYEDGLYKKIVGAMGSVTIVLNTGRPGVAEFDFLGAWAPPVDAPLLTPAWPTVLPPRFSSGTCACSSGIVWSGMLVSNVKITVNNTLTLREAPAIANNASGYYYAVVTDREITITMDPESPLVQYVDDHGAWIAGTTFAWSCTLGSSGNTIAFSAPKVQIQNIVPGDRNGLQTDELTLLCCRGTDAGDDELSINPG